jgi:hypothetical protein
VGIAAIASWSSIAYASAPPVRVTVDQCEAIDEAEVRRILSAELGTSPSNIAGPSVTDVVITCEHTRVIVRVRDPISRKAMQRSFDIGLSDPKARSRLVALASSELILASWAELEMNPRLKVAPEGPEPNPQAISAAKRAVDDFEYHPKPPPPWYETETPRDRLLRFVFMGSVRGFFDRTGTLWGGGFRVGEERFRIVSWSADFLFETGDVQTNAHAPYRVETGTLGAWLLLYKRWGILTGRAGAGLRLVAVSSTPRAPNIAEGSTTIAPWGWPLAASSLTLKLGPTFLVELSGEVGYAVLPVPSASDPGVRGAWFSGQFGVGFAL